jgi:hypothetical protein
MANFLSRRDFLKLATLTLGTLAFRPTPPRVERLPLDDRTQAMGLGRVARSGIYLYNEPSFQSDRLGYRRRDHLLELFEEIHSQDGPAYNPRWYRVVGAFVHSGYVQRVETKVHPPLERIPDRGRICEVSVPFTQTYRPTRSASWVPLYRLYFQSHHWVTGVDQGPDGKPWYRITDERLRVQYYAPAEHLRPLDPTELAPIHPWVPPEEKRIRISLENQTLTALEGDKPIFNARVATGVHTEGPSPNGIPTDTPQGRFLISRKMPVRHMGDGMLTDDPEAYELPGVPWCCFFVATGVATHGTYWHDNFGVPMSHGCVNMRNQDAKWIYRWANPSHTPRDWYSEGRGTVIDVIEG